MNYSAKISKTGHVTFDFGLNSIISKIIENDDQLTRHAKMTVRFKDNKILFSKSVFDFDLNQVISAAPHIRPFTLLGDIPLPYSSDDAVRYTVTDTSDLTNTSFYIDLSKEWSSKGYIGIKERERRMRYTGPHVSVPQGENNYAQEINVIAPQRPTNNNRQPLVNALEEIEDNLFLRMMERAGNVTITRDTQTRDIGRPIEVNNLEHPTAAATEGNSGERTAEQIARDVHDLMSAEQAMQRVQDIPIANPDTERALSIMSTPGRDYLPNLLPAQMRVPDALSTQFNRFIQQ